MIDDNSFNNFDFYLNGIVDEKKQLQIIKRKKEELDEMIKEMTWQDLVVEKLNKNGNSNNYEINFNKKIAGRIEEIKNLYETFNHLEDVGQEILFQGEQLSMDCSVQVGTLNNRIDISGDGIPRSIRGLGLGCKIYRAILEKEDYLTSSDHNLSSHGKMLWNSLRRSDLFYTFYHRTRAFCFSSDKEPKEIIQILIDNISPENFNQMLWDNDFVEKNRSLILNSSLAPLL
jgi:hypothetical protein